LQHLLLANHLHAMTTTSPATSTLQKDDATPPKVAAAPKRDYKGFVAGVFSGVAKLSGE
jgi:hypothetical protein